MKQHKDVVNFAFSQLEKNVGLTENSFFLF
jgi:hypothetical protein